MRARLIIASLAVVALVVSARALAASACTGSNCLYLAVVQKPEPSPTATTAPTATLAPTVTPTEVPGLPKFKNPGFEQGHTGWIEIPGNVVITQFSGVTPHAGQWLAHLDGVQGTSTEIQQAITLPAIQPLYLRYARQISSFDNLSNIDEFIVLANTTQLENETLNSITDTGGHWDVHTVNLSAFAGQTVTIRLQLNQMSSELTDVYLDDISLSSNP